MLDLHLLNINKIIMRNVVKLIQKKNVKSILYNENLLVYL